MNNFPVHCSYQLNHGVFNRFMRRTYELPREAVSALGEIPKAKPRLLIISRQRTRMFLNLPEIIAMAGGLGFEVVWKKPM